MLFNVERGAVALMWLAYPGLLLLTLPADALLEGGLAQSPVAGTVIVWLGAWLTLSVLAFAAACLKVSNCSSGSTLAIYRYTIDSYLRLPVQRQMPICL
jgi:hypothetical protein